MRSSGNTRPVIFGFILMIGITLTLPYSVFGAARSLGGSGRFNAPRIHRPFGAARSFGGSGRFKAPGIDRHRSFSDPFHGFGFVGVGGVSEQPVIIIHQFQPAAATEPSEPA